VPYDPALIGKPLHGEARLRKDTSR